MSVDPLFDFSTVPYVLPNKQTAPNYRTVRFQGRQNYKINNQVL